MAIIFPQNPVLNQIFNGYEWNGQSWRNIYAVIHGPAGTTGTVPGIQGLPGPAGSEDYTGFTTTVFSAPHWPKV